MDRQACLSNFHFIRVPIFFALISLILYSLKAHQLRSFSFRFTLYTLYFTLSTLLFPLYSFHFTLYTLLFILYSLYFTLYTLLFPLTSLPVFAWYATVVLLETFVEITLIHKADLEANLGYGIFTFKDKFCGNTHFLVHKVFVRTYA